SPCGNLRSSDGPHEVQRMAAVHIRLHVNMTCCYQERHPRTLDCRDFLRPCYCFTSEAPGELEMSAARMKHFGWGREGEGLAAQEEAFVMECAEARFGTALKESASAPCLEDIKLQAPHVTAPASLPFCTSEHYDRAAHTHGKSYPELARGLARD